MNNPGNEQYVEFPNSRGKVLRGMLHSPAASEKPPAPAVVLFHGFNGSRIGPHWMFVKCSRALAQAGIASLRFDFYASGESDGESHQMTLSGEINDGRTAVAFLRAQPGIDPKRVGVIGLSMGGAVAASLAKTVEAKALVLWSALAHTSRLRDLVKKSAKKVPAKPGALEFDARELNPRLFEDLLKVEPIRHLARYKGPTLIVHPEKDEVVPVSHAHDFFHAAGAETKELVIIAGADHAFTSVSWEQEVIARTLPWLLSQL
jgi:dienelactone hydrolase